MLQGEDWEDGFAKGLMNSLCFFPILSYGSTAPLAEISCDRLADAIAAGWDERPLGRKRLQGDDTDAEDNVLKEFIIAVALLEQRRAATNRSYDAQKDPENPDRDNSQLQVMFFFQSSSNSSANSILIFCKAMCSLHTLSLWDVHNQRGIQTIHAWGASSLCREEEESTLCCHHPPQTGLQQASFWRMQGFQLKSTEEFCSRQLLRLCNALQHYRYLYLRKQESVWCVWNSSLGCNIYTTYSPLKASDFACGVKSLI